MICYCYCRPEMPCDGIFVAFMFGKHFTRLSFPLFLLLSFVRPWHWLAWFLFLFLNQFFHPENKTKFQAQVSMSHNGWRFSLIKNSLLARRELRVGGQSQTINFVITKKCFFFFFGIAISISTRENCFSSLGRILRLWFCTRNELIFSVHETRKIKTVDHPWLVEIVLLITSKGRCREQ